MTRLKLIRILISVWLLIFFCQTVSAQQIIFESDFDSPASARADWDHVGNVGYSTSSVAESGRSGRISERSYLYTRIRIPNNTQSSNIKFWLRKGGRGIGDRPNGNSRFNISLWIPSQSRYENIVVARGSSNPGGVIQVNVDIPAGLIVPGTRQLVLLYNQANRGDYYVDNFVMTINAGGLDHFDTRIISGNANVCEPYELELIAKDSAGVTLDDYDGLVNISASRGHGNWSIVPSSNRFSPGGADTGLASYQFNGSENGVIRLRYSNSHAETTSLQFRDNAESVLKTEGGIRFDENAFVVDMPSWGRDVIAGRDHPVNVSLMKKIPGGAECGVAQEYNRNNLTLYLQRASDSPQGSYPFAIINGNQQSISETQRNVPLNFTNGNASFTLRTSDVDHFSIELLDDSDTFSDRDIVGSSGFVAVRPFAFSLNVLSNPAATSGSGSVFMKAGSNFGLIAKAVAYDAADDVNQDGVADGHDDGDISNAANLLDNPTLLSFGREVPPEGIKLDARPVLPSGVNHSQLLGETVLTVFNAGQSPQAQLSYSNVGIAELRASLIDGQYLGASLPASNKILGVSGPVGRFTPDHFHIDNSSATAACPSANFSHIGQGFTAAFTLQALNKQGVVTDGYQGEFLKLSSTLGELYLNGAAINGPVLKVPVLGSRFAIDTQNWAWNNGEAQFDGQFRLQRGTEPEPALQDIRLGVQILDADFIGITDADLDLDFGVLNRNDHHQVGLSGFYYSRLRLDGAHGPENSALPVIFQVESWMGNSFMINPQDSCTKISRANITYVGNGNLSDDNNRTISIGAGQTVGSYLDLSATDVGFINGNAGHSFSAPGGGNTGDFSVDVNLQDYPWLRYDWNQDGDHSDETLPTALYRFGQYRGHDRLIYWRETIN